MTFHDLAQPMKNWSKSTVIAWFVSFRSDDSLGGSETIDAVIARCKHYKISGSMLYNNLKTGDQVTVTFGILPIFGNALFAKINEKRNGDRNKKIQDATPDASKTAPQEEFFYLNFTAKGKAIKLKDPVSADTTIEDVMQFFFDQEVAPGSALDDEIKTKSVTFLSHGKNLKSNKTLRDYKITNSNNSIVVVFNARGGTYAGTGDRYRERTVNTKKFPRVKLSLEKDCITLEGNEAGTDRAGMPCGHAVCPETMYLYIRSIFLKNKKSVTIVCPVPECSKKWDWQLCTEVADMTYDEYAKWTEVRNRRLNALRNEKECPHCQALCKRKEGVVIFRMRCTQCSKSDWCWECGEVWKHSGLILCGNQKCNVVRSLNSELLKCKSIGELIKAKDHSELSDSYTFLAKCPSVRACPRCLNLVSHIADCKHMMCVGCEKKFCFYCLSLEDKSKTKTWPCGEYSDECFNIKPAKVQQFT